MEQSKQHAKEVRMQDSGEEDEKDSADGTELIEEFLGRIFFLQRGQRRSW